jgi:hypothetical protein
VGRIFLVRKQSSRLRQCLQHSETPSFEKGASYTHLDISPSAASSTASVSLPLDNGVSLPSPGLQEGMETRTNVVVAEMTSRVC